jgi:hypothetical protein
MTSMMPLVNAPDYLLPDPVRQAMAGAFTDPTTPEGDVGGWSGQAQHSGHFIEGDTVYIYFTDPVTGSIHVATAALETPTSFTHVGIVLTTPAGTVQLTANPHVMNVNGTYTMFFEARDSTTGYRWQIGRATCSTPTGTFASQAYPLPGLDFNSGISTASNPFIVAEGGGYTMWLHGSWGKFQKTGALPTVAYRATSTDLNTWSLLDGAQPVIRLEHPFEVDQVADLCLVESPSGVRYAFWSANDNTYSTGHIFGAVLEPAPMKYQAGQWIPLRESAPRGGMLPWPYLGFNRLSTAFTTTTVGSAVTIAGLGFTGITLPDSSRVTVKGSLLVKSDTAGASITVKVAMSGVVALQGATSATVQYDNLNANEERTFPYDFTFDIGQGRTWSITVTIQNTASGATTTVLAGDGSQTMIDTRRLA